MEAGKAAEGRLAEDWAAWGEAKSDWSACRLLAGVAEGERESAGRGGGRKAGDGGGNGGNGGGGKGGR